MTASLPSGIVTFLMSDVVASTRLWSDHGAAMDAALARLSDDIRRHVEAHGGVVVQARGEGDSHFAAFPRASSAALAAVALQRARRETAWPTVRIALHAAEVDPVGGDYLGAEVNRAARLRSSAHGGQTVCSRGVAAFVDGVEGLHVSSLGLHRVRDVPGWVELFQVSGSGEAERFPPPKTEDISAAPLMTFVAVDQAASSARASAAPGGLAEWQGGLYRTLRDAADARDGRFFKFVGDGCLVGFEDPLTAVDFAERLGATGLGLRAAVAVGRTEVVEGEPASPAIWEAVRHAGTPEPGGVWLSPLVRALVPERAPAPVRRS